MIKKNMTLLNALNILTDVLLMIMCFCLSWVTFKALSGEAMPIICSLSELIVLMSGYYAFIIVGTYSINRYNWHRHIAYTNESLFTYVVCMLATVLLFSIMHLLDIEHFASKMLLLNGFMCATVLMIKQAGIRYFLRLIRFKGLNQKHLILCGNGRLAQNFAVDVQKNAILGFTIDGYVANDHQDNVGKYLGKFDEIEAILNELEPDEMVIALEPQHEHYMVTLIRAAEKNGCRVSVIPFYNKYIPSNPEINVVGKTKLIDLRSTPLDNLFWSFIKRTVDILGSLALIVVTSPVMLAVAIGVKLSGPGPIIFRQERVGLKKKVFTMYKFRSMVVTDEEDTGWSTNRDPRKTRFGSIIRKFSLDELPQFFNVLFGDMSLVGPRPEVPFHVDHFKEEIPLYLLRQQIRPGITGWAQINGWRGDTDIEERVKCDIWYIENWSIMLDLKILLLTIFGGMKNDEKIETLKRKKILQDKSYHVTIFVIDILNAILNLNGLGAQNAKS